jgi:hypothetical protein
MKHKFLNKKSNYNNTMRARCEKPVSLKAQVAIEHLTVTAAILAMVTIAFAFGFVTFDQNIKIAKARDALTALTGTANEVYTFGEGNTRFVDVSFPAGMPENYITIVNLCGDKTNLECPATGNETICDCKTPVVGGGSGAHEDVNFSAIKLRVGLLGGETEILRESKAKLVLDNFPSAEQAAGGPPYPIRVSWTDDGKKIRLQRV